MTDADDRLMAATMTWLRALLSPAAPAAVAGRRRFRDPPVESADSRAPVRRARRALEQAMAADPAPRFTSLCDSLGLRPFERDVALLCLGHAVSTEIESYLNEMPESTGGAPTFALAMELAQDPVYDNAASARRSAMTRVAAPAEWDALAPDRPLRRWRMLEVAQPVGRALISSSLRLDERVVNHIKGRDYLDDRLTPYVDPMRGDDGEGLISSSQLTQLSAALDLLRRLAPQRHQLLVQMPGGDTATKRLFARGIAGELGHDLYRLTVDQLPDGVDLATLVDLWNRENHLQRVALLIDALDSQRGGALARLLRGVDGLVLVDVREALHHAETALVLDVARPHAGEQRAMWEDLLGGSDGDAGSWPRRLTAQFDLNPAELVEVAVAAGPTPDAGPVAWEICRVRARARLEGLAQRVTTDTTLDDVALPGPERRQLEQVRDQTRHRMQVYEDYGFRTRLSRGLGVTALLAGESGTGKTMAAEALANELRLDLYRIDLAGVVSKYIGETEKNLQRVFDAAEQSSAVLLFDEADAIFGKRSEVHDSHDRYANLEVAFLLQRMEAYEGLAILTTNMRNALDPSFLRRLRFVITFPFPGIAERELIWRHIFPAAESTAELPAYLVPGVERLNMAELAKPNLTGGQIRNIALNAAFLAAAGAGAGEVSMALLAETAREELRKSNRPFVAADFASWEREEQIERVSLTEARWPA